MLNLIVVLGAWISYAELWIGTHWHGIERVLLIWDLEINSCGLGPLGMFAIGFGSGIKKRKNPVRRSN